MRKRIAIAAAITASLALVGRCVAPNYGGQGSTHTKPNNRSNRAPGDAFGANRTNAATDNGDGRSRWNDSRACFGGSR